MMNLGNNKGISVCPECGTECGAGDKFCRECGAGLGVIDTQPAMSGPSTMPFSVQLSILGGGLAVVTVLFFLYRGMHHEHHGSSVPQNQNVVPAQTEPGVSPHELTDLPADFNGLVNMGNQRMDASDYGMAAECYRRALEINPAAYDVRVDFAISLHSVGMSSLAIEELRKVCLESPNHPLAFFNLGIVFKETHQEDSAKAYLTQYLARFPNSPNTVAAKAALQELSN